jgi:hypothetical protein
MSKQYVKPVSSQYYFDKKENNKSYVVYFYDQNLIHNVQTIKLDRYLVYRYSNEFDLNHIKFTKELVSEEYNSHWFVYSREHWHQFWI